MKPLPTLLVFVAGLVVGVALCFLALRGPLTAEPAAAAKRGQEAPPASSLQKSQLVDHDAWSKEGFVEMVPPVRLPSDVDELGRIQVWLRIPQGRKIEVEDVRGRPTLRFPPGTLADRVESYRYQAGQHTVTDVRGTLLEENDGEVFHVFVPETPMPRGKLVGWEWRRGDKAAADAAAADLVATLKRRGDTEDFIIERYRRNNACASCHVHNKRENVERRRGIHRATDDSGFFVPLTVLEGEAPFEEHRPRDMNVGDPFLTLSCPSGSAPQLMENGKARHWRCRDGGSPVGKLDVKAALAAKDERTVALCRSRAYLREHTTDEGRAAFAAAWAECGL